MSAVLNEYLFFMSDAWGDDYEITIKAESESEAQSIANLLDDDAVGELISMKAGKP